jgi:hypothetical protein
VGGRRRWWSFAVKIVFGFDLNSVGHSLGIVLQHLPAVQELDAYVEMAGWIPNQVSGHVIALA